MSIAQCSSNIKHTLKYLFKSAGLEKMEREKQKAIEREEEKRAREVAEKEKKRLEEEELQRLKAEASGQPVLPPKSKFVSIYLRKN